MKRRTILAGLGATALGGSALLGSGAFSRVESQRDVTVQVATDENAYLGMKPLDTPNSNNFVELDDDGHLTIDVGEHSDAADENRDVTEPAQGVNSDSFTFFDGMFDLCNQGKEAACLSYDLPEAPDARAYGDDFIAPDPDYDQQVITFYYISEGGDDPGQAGDRIMIQEGQSVPLPLGECKEIGLRTVTKGVDATLDAPLVEGEAVVTADVNEYDNVGGTSLGARRGGDPLAVQNISTQSLGITDLSDPGLGPTDLANTLLPAGSGIGVSNVNFVGADAQGGTFTGGTGIVGFSEGILLSSGDVNDVAGPNDAPDTTTNHGNPGDSDLDDLAGTGNDTLDAATLEFEFTVPQGTDTIGFNYVFGSEEYNEFVGSDFNDVFGFFLNGQNVAVVDNPDGPGTIPAAINNINEGQPGVSPTNPDLYINNDPVNPNFDGETVASGDLLDTEMDGLTVVLDIEGAVNDGQNETNTLKLGVADTSDRILDSWVLLEAESLETDPEPTSPCGGS